MITEAYPRNATLCRRSVARASWKVVLPSVFYRHQRRTAFSSSQSSRAVLQTMQSAVGVDGDPLAGSWCWDLVPVSSRGTGTTTSPSIVGQESAGVRNSNEETTRSPHPVSFISDARGNHRRANQYQIVSESGEGVGPFIMLNRINVVTLPFLQNESVWSSGRGDDVARTRYPH